MSDSCAYPEKMFYKIIPGILLMVTIVATCGGQNTRPLVLKNATILVSAYDSIINNGTIIIRRGKIEQVGKSGKISIPENARVIDCNGNFILPGFWNSHVHFTEKKWKNAAAIPKDSVEYYLREFLSRYGFIYAFDLGSPFENTLELKKRIYKKEITGPSIFVCGRSFVPEHAQPYYSPAIMDELK